MLKVESVRSMVAATTVKQPQIVNSIGSKTIHRAVKSVGNIPNEVTRRALYEVDNDIDLHRFGNAEEMFVALGI